MKTLFSLSFLAVLAVTSSADVGPMSVGAAVDRDLAVKSIALQTSPTPPPSILTFAPGSSWGIAGVALPPGHGSRGWQGSVCVETTIGTLPLGPRWSIQSDGLLGARFANSGLTGGLGAGVHYASVWKLPTVNLNVFFFGGVAYMAASGMESRLAPQGGAGVTIWSR